MTPASAAITIPVIQRSMEKVFSTAPATVFAWKALNPRANEASRLTA